MSRRALICMMALCLFALEVDQAVAQRDEPPPAGPAVTARPIADGLGVPVVLTEPADGSGRRFVVDQLGQVRIIDSDDRLRREPFLDLSDRLVELDPDYDERGLLGLAFHPDYADNGRFFVHYSAPRRARAPRGWDHTGHLSEFRVSGDDPDRADPGFERIVLQVDQPYENHNGGHIAFGRDGMLYVPLGDGGNGGDVDAEGDDLAPRPPEGNAQHRDNVLGSILRIDIDGAEPYSVPEDNPFAGGDEGAGEVWAYGLRNPYGFSVDAGTGDLYAFDAGQALFEIVNRIQRGGNYGWNIREGTHCFDPDDHLDPPDDCPDTGQHGEPLINPVVEYRRGPRTGSVTVGGVFYRGEKGPALRDRLVFADYSRVRFVPDGVLYMAEPREGGLWPIRRLPIANLLDGRRDGDLDRFVLAVEQDAEGEIYALTTRAGGPSGRTGEVLALEAHTPAAEPTAGPAWWWLAAGAMGMVGVVAGAATLLRRRRGAPADSAPA